jgi:MFS family permease
LDLGIGFAFDIFGRKVPMAIAYFCTSIGLFILPCFTRVYPWFLISRLFISLSTITVNCPFIPDYIDEKSQGLANGYFLMIVSFANILSTTVLLEVSEIVNPTYIYIGAAIFVAIVSLLIYSQMKDVIKEENEYQVNHSPKFIIKQMG